LHHGNIPDPPTAAAHGQRLMDRVILTVSGLIASKYFGESIW